VRHPRWVVLAWVVLLLLSLPLLSHVSAATSPSTVSLPASSPSQQAQALFARVFPNLTADSSSLIVLTGNNVTGPVGRNVTVQLAAAILNDRSLQALQGVSSLYSAYQAYLAGQGALGLATLSGALRAAPSPLLVVNQTAALLWGVASTYTTTWQALVGSGGSGAARWNYPAYQMTYQDYAGDPPALQNLSLFYNGSTTPGNGFNGTADCAADPSAVVACSTEVVLAVHARERATPLGAAVLDHLGLLNFTSWPAVQRATAFWIGAGSGLPGGWLDDLWTTFPGLDVPTPALAGWAGQVVDTGTIWTYPLPVPPSLRMDFLSPGNNVTLLSLSYSRSDSSAPVASDIATLGTLVPLTLDRADPSHSLTYYQTGDAALVVSETNLINQDTDTILPVTLLLLLGIIVIYFRSALAPVVILTTIGMALALGLGTMVLLSLLLGPFTQTSVTLLLTFVLGVGTDYSVFLTARYKEELIRGSSSPEAVVTAVGWAGESVATSGVAVVLATLAMALSGTSLIADWGKVLSMGVAIAVLVAVTLVPAVLSLLGPRVFWPYTGARFQRYAKERNRRFAEGKGYFHQASTFSTRHPGAVVGVVALLSLPLVYVALTAPSDYSYFDQLPSSAPAAQGLSVISHAFGPGYVFPMTVLVTLAAPPFPPGGVPNATELSELSTVNTTIATTPGVARVTSLFGPGGAPLPTWLDLPDLPPAVRAGLSATLSQFVGTDGRTVLFTVYMTESGQSTAAVETLDSVRSELTTYALGHPDLVAMHYGGAPAVTEDLKDQLAQSTDLMFLAIVVGLLLFLFVALGSALLPPLALITIGISVAWAWAITALLTVDVFGLSLFFYVPPVLFLLIMGLGMDYNIFLLTRVREERLRIGRSTESVVEAVTHTGGIITAAGMILAGAFFSLTLAHVVLLRVLGFAVGLAVLLDAMVVRTYLVPALLRSTGERAWWGPRWVRRRPPPPTGPEDPSSRR
jgi:RND superfamily putative drug exporter